MTAGSTHTRAQTAILVAFINIRLPILLGALVNDIVAVCKNARHSLRPLAATALRITGYYIAQVCTFALDNMCVWLWLFAVVIHLRLHHLFGYSRRTNVGASATSFVRRTHFPGHRLFRYSPHGRTRDATEHGCAGVQECIQVVHCTGTTHGYTGDYIFISYLSNYVNRLAAA